MAWRKRARIQVSTFLDYDVVKQLEEIKQREGTPLSRQVREAIDQWLVRSRGWRCPPLGTEEEDSAVWFTIDTLGAQRAHPSGAREVQSVTRDYYDEIDDEDEIDYIARLEAEVAELRKDKERLDWLESFTNKAGPLRDLSDSAEEYETIREWLDAAGPEIQNVRRKQNAD